MDNQSQCDAVVRWATTAALLTLTGCSGTAGDPALDTSGTAQGGAASATIGGQVAATGGATANAAGAPGFGGSTATGASNATGGTPTTGGSTAAIGSGGSPATGGAASTRGGAASGGATTVSAGTTGSGGASVARGGTTSSGGASVTRGGTTSSGGASVTRGGTTSSGGTTATGGKVSTGGTTSGTVATGGAGGNSVCGATPNPNPFGCKFAWGLNGVNPANYPYIQYISNWAGYAIKADGTITTCDTCNWLKNTMASATQVPVLIAYLISYWGHANGLPDGNVNPNGPNLTNGMGELLLGVANAACPSGVICENNLMVKAYAWYAAQVYAVYKKPVIWWMEGDFVQYSPQGAQKVPISWEQTGQLAAQITRAIKCNDPAAVIAWNYSTWISVAQRDSYFNAINSNVAKLGTSYEMVFTTGKGNTANAGTGTTWDQLYAAAGNKPIMCDESFGLSVAGDTWANQTAATINARIAQHFIGPNITTSTIPSYLQANLTSTLAPSALNSTCF